MRVYSESDILASNGLIQFFPLLIYDLIVNSAPPQTYKQYASNVPINIHIGSHMQDAWKSRHYEFRMQISQVCNSMA